VTARRGRPTRPQPDIAYVDTNLFVALLVGASHSLHDRALAVFRRVADGELALTVTPIIVAELVYVTRSELGWSRPITADRIGSLLQADGLIVTERPTILRALDLFGASTKLAFADSYLAAVALQVGPPAVATFDSDFDTVGGVRRISA
jgi:predicted nucleic acid-binding protein